MAIQKQLMSAGFSAQQAQALGATQIGALAGSAQSDATKITSPAVIFTSGSGGGVLPTPDAGDEVIVVNVSGNTASIYPAGTGIINALSASAAISMATAKSAIFKAQTGGSAAQWRTVPLVPS